MSDNVMRVDPEEWFPNHKRGTHALVPWEKYESLRAEISEKDSLITELRSEVERLKSREITDEQIDEAWEYVRSQIPFEPEHDYLIMGAAQKNLLHKLGIVACPKCGGTNRYIDPHLNYQECECPSCSNNGWIREERGDE